MNQQEALVKGRRELTVMSLSDMTSPGDSTEEGGFPLPRFLPLALFSRGSHANHAAPP